ncbi:MAG TPA: GAF domain-containing protein [Roseiflexaceae bacterium]|nr:GAF domain-containing protein [Roseiflexaceae bacterium]
MSTLLARWLTEHRDLLLPRWIAALERTLYHVPHNGIEDADGPAIVAHPDERRVLLTSMYEGLISAAAGDYAPLDECLRLLRALRTTPGEDELPQQLALIFQLRRTAMDLIDDRGLALELEDLLEYVAITSANRWVLAAKSVSRELHETKLLVESLYHEAEVSDRTTLHVSKLNEITQGLTASLDQAQQLETVGEKLYQVLGVTALAVWMYDEAAGQLALARAWGAPDEAPAAPVDPASPGDLVARAFQLGQMVLELEPDAAAQGGWYRSGCAVLAVPLVAQRGVTGVIAIQHTAPETLADRAEQEFVRSAASQTAIALENARLYEEVRGFNAALEQRIAERTRELQVERDMLETLNAIALEISSTLDEHLLMESSLTALARLVGVEHGSIMLVEPETEHLVDRAVLDEKADVGYTRFPMGHGIVGWVAQHRKPALVPDVSKDERWVAPHDDDSYHKRSGSMICVPLIAHHEVQGVLVLSHDEPDYFRDEHLRLLTASASQIAIGIHNAQIYKEVEQQLMHRYEMQRRQEEAASQSAAILQSLSDGVIVCDAYGSVLTANTAAERILERPIEELVTWQLPELMKRLLGRRASEIPVDDMLAHPRDEHDNPRSMSATFQIGRHMVSVNLDPVLASKGELIGAVAVFRDITREVESDRLKTEFIATVSHELRTPMAAIKGFTQLLAMGSLGALNDTQKEFLGIIQSNAERMIAIINDLLDITKIETGSVELDLRPLHVAESLSGVLLELQPKVLEREQQLSVGLPPGLPLVRADARRFNQILLNLLSNAVKYTPRGGSIEVQARDATAEVVPEHLREGLKPGRYVQIDVRDTGVGIAADELEKIFERFYRTENPLKVEAGGTGLGLSLVRPLVKLFGGRIWVESTLGEGTTFSFVIPAV